MDHHLKAWELWVQLEVMSQSKTTSKKRSPYFDVSLILRVFTFHWKKRVFPGKDFRKKGILKLAVDFSLKVSVFLVFLLLFNPQIFLQCWYGGTHHDILAVFKCKRDKQEKKKF